MHHGLIRIPIQGSIESTVEWRACTRGEAFLSWPGNCVGVLVIMDAKLPSETPTQGSRQAGH